MEKIQRLCENMESVILGKPGGVRLVIIGLLSGGHVLIEDVPGVGKSTLARALARSIQGTFRRIQFTPDLLPSDITGIAVYDRDEKKFVFKPGPIFTHILLADEINRTTPRTQSALLEAMNVGQVSVDGTTYPLPRPFMVLATQNPLEYTGTYPLPESQLDRFHLRVHLNYPSREDEKKILLSRRLADPLETLEPVISAEEISKLIERVREVVLEVSILEYIQDIIEATRRHRRLVVGASPRASLNLYRTAQARAYVEGRDYVLPDDVKVLAVPVLAHRIVTREEFRTAAPSRDSVRIIQEILSAVKVPI